jgi:hypothetical protein
VTIPDRYLSGLSGEERRRRAAEIKRGKKTDTDDKSAYSPSRFKTDDGKKTKTSKYTKRGRKLLAGSDAKTKSEKFAVLAKKTGYSTATLQKVYDRGLAAWRTGHRPGASQHAWAMARVYSFVTGGKTTKTADKDLVREAEIHFMAVERQLRRKYSDRLVEISIRGMSSKFIAGRARQWATQAAGAAQSDRIIRGGRGVTVSRDLGGAGGGRFVSQIQQAEQARANAIKSKRRADRLRGRSQNGARLTFGDPLFAPAAQRVAAQRRQDRGTDSIPDIPPLDSGGFRYGPEFFGDGTEDNRRFAPYDADLLTGAVDRVLGRSMLEANRDEVERALEEVLPGPGTKNQEFLKEFNRRLGHLHDLGERLGIEPMMKQGSGRSKTLVPVPKSVKSLAAARKLADAFDADNDLRDNTFPGIKDRGATVELGGGVVAKVDKGTIKKIVGRSATEEFVEDLWWTDLRTQASMREILMRYYDDPEYREKMVDDISWYPRMRGVLWTLAGRMAPEFGTDQDTMFKRLSFSIANLSANRNWFEGSIDKETGKPTRTLDDLEALYRGDISIDDLSGKERNDNVSVVMMVLSDFLTPSEDNPGKSKFDDKLARSRAGETSGLYGIQYNQEDTMERVASSLMGDIDADLQLSIERVRDQGLGYLIASSKFAPSQKFDTFGTGNIYGAAPDGNTHDQRQGMLTQLMLPSIAGSNNIHAKKPSPAMFYAGRTAQHRLAERLGLPPEAAHALQSVEWEHWSNWRRYRIRDDGRISIDPRDKKFMPSREHPEVVETVVGGRENRAYTSSVAAWERKNGKKYKNPEERAKERQAKKKALNESESVADPMPTAYERNRFAKAMATMQFGDIQEMADAMQEIMVILLNMKRREKANNKIGEFVESRLRDPKGGLTAAGRAYFKRKEGANLKPGVRGAADTPEKMRRKGSFLTRFYTNPSGPMVRPNGKPSRLALAAAAWGEPVPKTADDAGRLAAKGRRMLAAYERSKNKKA